MIDRATIDRIMDAVNIVDVVSDFVSLRKRGTSYKGLCPFHDDRTPSFSVSPAKGVYKCFSCGKAGNAVNFIMEHEQMTYPEALRWLANKYHIEIKEREQTDEEREQQNERESMLIVNEWAAKYFADILHNDVDGRAIGMQYFRSRGFRDDIIERFQLGFAPKKRDAMATAATAAGYKAEYLEKTGLCYLRRDEQGNPLPGATLQDRFAGRVIFPWMGVSGKVTAFGGRLLDSRTKGVAQKYVNSPDSVIYHKDHELYGIFQAKRAIVKEDCVYMVEGYTDVISMHQCGIENVVANSGTALSIFQIKLLRRFTQNIVLLYDGDEAGIHAAMRGTDMLLSEGMNVKVLLLPDQEDPDSFARKHTAADFRQYIADHQTDFIEFKTQLLLRGVSDPIKRSEAINNIVKSISVIVDPIVRATYIQECARRIGIAETTLISQMNKFIRAGVEEKQKEAERDARAQQTQTPTLLKPKETQQKVDELEDMIVQLVMRHGEVVIFHQVEIEGTDERVDLSVAQYIYYELEGDHLELSTPLYRRILNEAVTHAGEEGFVAETYFNHHTDIQVSSVAARMTADDGIFTTHLMLQPTEEYLRNMAQHLVLDFKQNWVEQRLAALKREIALAAGDMQRLTPVLTEYREMSELRNLIGAKVGRRIGR